MGMLISIFTTAVVFFGTLALVNFASLSLWRRSFRTYGNRAQIGGTEIFYRLQGEGPVTAVVCTDLGSTSAEWSHIAESLASEVRVLTYDRPGYGFSGRPKSPRTPENIAAELKDLIDASCITGPLVLIGHGQGGLYAQKFIRMYPGDVLAAIFIDPFTAEEGVFKVEGKAREYQRSGLDKSSSLKTYRVLSNLGIVRLFEPIIAKIPPLNHMRAPSPETKRNILQAMNSPLLYRTAIEEYTLARKPKHIEGLASPDGFPPIPITLLLHDPRVIIEEIVLYRGLAEPEARDVEDIWRRIMERYLSFSPQSTLVTVQGGSHFCHLDSEETVLEAIRKAIR
ncbi:MAG TPA: alpha/beta hydrolase [Spirochaetia bacterium]|nr:alpha/beta hydrolase [Spirochaetia bacterium]